MCADTTTKQNMDEFLFLTDLHVKVSTLSLLAQLWAFLTKWFLKHSVATIVIGGDTLDTHERVCVHALNAAVDFLQFLAEHAPVVILVGNHDYINNSQFLSSNHWLNVLKPWPNITVVDHVVCMRRQKKTVTFVPYVPPGSFARALATSETAPDLIFAHQEFRGCRLGGIVSTEGDRWPTVPVISGHIHEAHKVGPVIYPGSSICLSTGYPSLGPCTVQMDGTVTHIGFSTSLGTQTLLAPLNAPPQVYVNTKLRLKGTTADVSQTLGNPLIRPVFRKGKIVIIDTIYNANWETHITQNLKTRALRDDYLEISRDGP